jgi:hypothetical protein
MDLASTSKSRERENTQLTSGWFVTGLFKNILVLVIMK